MSWWVPRALAAWVPPLCRALSVAPPALPPAMRAVVVKQKVGRFDESCKACFEVEELPVPAVLPDQDVLVRVARAQINPSDSSYFKGMYGKPLELPGQAGFEGCGTVVRSGADAGLLPVGTRVAFRSFGTWAEYCTAPVSQCIPLEPGTEWGNAAGALVNPLTAYTMVQLAKQRGDKTILATAAASGLGRQLIRYASACGIATIAVVRRPELRGLCMGAGAAVALDSSTEDFLSQLKEVCDSTGCALCFDAVAGAQAGQILSALAPGGKMYVYGGLSGKPIDGVAWNQLIFQRKALEGFWMTDKLNRQLTTPGGTLAARSAMTDVGKLLRTHLRTDVSRTFALEEVGDALVFMRRNMSMGKVQLVTSHDSGGV